MIIASRFIGFFPFSSAALLQAVNSVCYIWEIIALKAYSVNLYGNAARKKHSKYISVNAGQKTSGFAIQTKPLVMMWFLSYGCLPM